MKGNKSFLKFAKIIISILLISIILYQTDFSEGRDLILQARIFYVGMAFVIAVFAIFLSAYKWQLVLVSQGLVVPFFKLVSFYFVGLFFNNFLPTSIGGDVVRAYDLSRTIKSSSYSIASILAERILASVALGFTAAFALLLGYQLAKPYFSWIIMFLALSLLIFIFVAYLHRWERSINRMRWKSLRTYLLEISNGMRLPLKNKSTLFWILFLSFLFQTSVVLINLVIFHAFNLKVSAVYCFIFIPIISALSMLPVSVNGLGLREGAYIYFFGRLGLSATQAVSASLAFFFIVTLTSLLGGAILLVRRANQ